MEDEMTTAMATPLSTAKDDLSIWFMKCPPVVSKAWQSSAAAAADSPPVAKVIISINLIRPEDPSSLECFVMEGGNSKAGSRKVDSRTKLKRLLVLTEGVTELLLDGKAHGPSWLIGKYVKSDKCSTSGTTNSQISDLMAKIRQEVVDEMEEKLEKKVQQEVDAQVNKKVQENLTWVLKKLGEVNPSLNINLVELCPTISSDNDNGTPITGGDATS